MSFATQLLVAAFGGGGMLKLIEWALDYAGLREDAESDFRKDLMARVQGLRGRVDNLESELQDEQRARVKAELRNEIGERRIRMLVKELNTLRQKMDMEQLDPDEFLVTDVPIHKIPTQPKQNPNG